LLQYKCSLAGINVVVVNEAFTSKCSFVDNETVSKHDVYAGQRIKRGLFHTKEGKLINADVNGSYNIMWIGLKKLKCNCDALSMMPADKRFVYNPVRVCL
jgi:transposase